ncbi:transcriptional repressor MprA [Escherichia coli]|uniref:transcriptional repressor MprA n=1 Tax=Escherichia coli TaxID=562 RepID=UPI000BE17262|nr:transcriptional repressor MprA [Escherichia coli]
MASSFILTEQMLNSFYIKNENIPYQEILLTRLFIHTQSKLIENINKALKKNKINDTLLMALIVLEAHDDYRCHPSELSTIIGESRPNVTRITDKMEKRGWISRYESKNDRRCLHLQLTNKGLDLLNEVLPQQHRNLYRLWSVLNAHEKEQFELLMHKLLSRLNLMNSESPQV